MHVVFRSLIVATLVQQLRRLLTRALLALAKETAARTTSECYYAVRDNLRDRLKYPRDTIGFSKRQGPGFPGMMRESTVHLRDLSRMIPAEHGCGCGDAVSILGLGGKATIDFSCRS